jgi:hypothetical protein
MMKLSSDDLYWIMKAMISAPREYLYRPSSDEPEKDRQEDLIQALETRLGEEANRLMIEEHRIGFDEDGNFKDFPVSEH